MHVSPRYSGRSRSLRSLSPRLPRTWHRRCHRRRPAPDHAALTLAGQRAMAVTLLATVLWSTEALPLAATALACVALLPVVGATPTIADALVGFAQPVPYFLYSVLVLGLAAGKSGLAEHVARWFLALARSRPGRPVLAAHLLVRRAGVRPALGVDANGRAASDLPRGAAPARRRPGLAAWQGGDAGAGPVESPRVERAADRRHHPGDGGGAPRRARLGRVVHADGRAGLRDAGARRRRRRT